MKAADEIFACRLAISFYSELVGRQHIPHSLRRFLLRGSSDVGVGVQGEAGGVVTQHAGDRWPGRDNTVHIRRSLWLPAGRH